MKYNRKLKTEIPDEERLNSFTGRQSVLADASLGVFVSEGIKMNQTKHTPGPWKVGKVDENGGVPIYAGDNSGEFARITYTSGNNQHMVDAHLIAAAPELLEVLKKVFVRLPEENESDKRVLDLARQVIAKAEGK